MSSHPAREPFSRYTEQYSQATQVAATPVAREKPAGAEPSRPSRLVVCAVAVCMGVLILLEPLLIDAKPGLQVFYAAFVIWFSALFMFAGTSDRSNGK